MGKKPIHKRLKNGIIYIVVLFFVRLLRSMSRLASIRLMNFVGRLAYILAGKEREKTIRHLTWAFAEKSEHEVKILARQVFQNLSTMVADAIRIPCILNSGIDRLVVCKDVERIERSYANGKGVIFLTGHFCNWELLGAWLAYKGYKLKVVGRQAYDPRLDKIVVETRNKAGYTNIARGKGTREIVRSLRQNYGIGMLIDQDTNVDGVFVNFFNRPAHTAVGPVVLAHKLGSLIIPIFIRLKKDLTYQISVGKPLELEWTDDLQHDLVMNIQKCSDVYEDIIRRYPEYWVWMHERWKKQP